MHSLFSQNITPLASLFRPEKLDEIVGQKHLVGIGKPIRKFIEAKRFPSILLWGPPGCGKTSLAKVISKSLNSSFFNLSGTLSKKEDLIKIITKAKLNYDEGVQTILFLDEIHRWSKTQQDVLLPWVEKGIITLIGATTENPSFTVINALLSRCRTYILKPITEEEIFEFLDKNQEKIKERYEKIIFTEDSLKLLAHLGGGDLRNTLNLVESSCILEGEGELQRENILEAGSKSLMYDSDSQEHYNLISAMHKSLRDSDGDAAIYRIGRMLAGGEDPRYIARRMINFASEDIFDIQAIILANSVYEICEKMGMPECELPLLNCAYYLADAEKNNSIYLAQAIMHKDIEELGNLDVPNHLKNAPTKFMKDIGYGKGYEYAHNLENKKSLQEHFPEELKGRKYRNT